MRAVSSCRRNALELCGPCAAAGSKLCRQPLARAALALPALLACQAALDLRDTLNPEEEGPDQELAGILVVVEPGVPMQIFVDGAVVSTISPFGAYDLPPGPHELAVQASGYHPFSTRLLLTAGNTLEFPVVLRPLEQAQEPEPSPDVSSHAPEATVRKAGEPSPSPGASGVRLSVEARPAVRVMVDGRPVRGATATFLNSRGRLSAGSLSLVYRLGDQGGLDLVIPGDQGRWFKDGRRLRSRSRVRVGARAVRLRRIGRSGRQQALVLRCL